METEQKTKTRRQPVKNIPWRIAAFALLLVLLVVAVALRLSGTGNTEPTEETVPEETENERLNALLQEFVYRAAVPEGYHRLQLPEEELSKGDLVLVNNDHHFDAEQTTDLLSIYLNKTEHYQVKDWETSLAPQMMEALNAWLEDGYEETELLNVNVVAGYRSYETQKQLHENAEALHGKAYADSYISLPGASEHHTGLAVDLSMIIWYDNTTQDFTGEGEQAWYAEHAWEYGLILRYPEGKMALTGIATESWHYRYVGLPHAQIITEKGLCLEEYIDLLRNYKVGGEHLCGECQGKPYEIYFCKAADLMVPDEGTYTISGNNVDGYIVTIY